MKPLLLKQLQVEVEIFMFCFCYNNTGCGSANGLIRLDIAGGTPNFDIYVNGSFWINTNDRWYSITGLAGEPTPFRW
ncbi:MAG: hypothetical protein R2879_02630 [Saprospiraceae bacterium]